MENDNILDYDRNVEERFIVNELGMIKVFSSKLKTLVLFFKVK